MQALGKKAFISYRGSYYPQAQAASQWLIANQYIKEAVVFPPNSLSEANEVLMPYEYIELMEFILDHLSRCDVFVFLNSADYNDSYFTQAEILQWRRFRDVPVVYSVGSDEVGNFSLSEPIALQELASAQKRMWAHLSVSIARSYRSKFNPGFQGGRFNRNCFLTACSNCGEHYLISKGLMADLLLNHIAVLCPHCQAAASFREENHLGNFYRKPIIRQQPGRKSMRVLQVNEILDLLVSNEAIPSIPLLSKPGETLRSDMGKLGRFWAGAAAVGLGLLAVSSILADDSDDKS